MSFILPLDAKVDISFSRDYSKAIFGLHHIAFIKNDGKIVLPIENKDAIINAYNFYKNKVKLFSVYPYNNRETNIIVRSDDERILKQIIGLPLEVYEKIDFSKDISKQLVFEDNLSLLKKECYSLLYKQYKKKWFTDDFKLFMINNGVFFPYDETKPFISNKQIYPIHIDESLFSNEIKNIINCKHSLRLALDFVNKDLTLDLYNKMELFDSFSLERKINYFINNQEDEEISSLISNQEFKIRYTYLLKLFVVSIVNLLYDDYSFKVLNKVTSRLSFLSIQKIHADKKIYVLSGNFLEAFSYNKKDWFLSIEDKERLYKQFLKEQLKSASTNPIIIFAHIGLPYILFSYVKKKSFITADDFVNCFEYKDIPFSIVFQAPKRSELYSYIVGDNKHLLITLRRELFRRGMDYSSINPFDKKNYYESSTIIIDVNKKHTQLYDLVENSSRQLHTDLFIEYSLENKVNDLELINNLKLIDEKSNNSALYFFYHIFNNVSVSDALIMLLNKYDLREIYSHSLLDYFFYLYSHPFDIAYLQVRKYLLSVNDSSSLQAIEISPGTADIYEPNMPYPYVSFGKAFYSFRKSFYSAAYLPLEEKQNVIEREKELLLIAKSKFNKKHDKKILIENFIRDNFGLPKNISSTLNFSKSISSQIKFKEGISHLSVFAEPSIHNNIDFDSESAYNIYSTYIVSNAINYGLLINELSLGEESFIFSTIKNMDRDNYYGIIHYNFEKLLPVARKYIDDDYHTLYAIILSFYSNNFSFISRCYDLVEFVKYNSGEIKEALFEKIDDFSFIQRNFFLFIMLASIYKAVELSYAIYVSKDKIKELELSPYSMNIDYQPRLQFPIVHLGRVFNAYSSNDESDDYYFCSCEKDSIYGLLDRIYSMLEESCPEEIITPLSLSLIGLPYVVVKKYSSLDLKSVTVKSFVNNILVFKDGICRRCSNIPHAIYKGPFIKAFPNKDDMIAEYSIANNALAHDGMLLMPNIPLNEITYSSSYIYNLKSYFDDRIPNILYYGVQPPESSYTFFCMTMAKLNDYIHEFIQHNKRIEVAALACGIITDTYAKNKEVFFDFIFKKNGNTTLEDKIKSSFPEISRARDNMIENVEQVILGFLTFLMEKFILKYVEKEKGVGK